MEERNRKIRLVYAKVPERVWQDAVKFGINKTMDVWLTDVLLEEIENRRKEEERNGKRRK